MDLMGRCLDRGYPAGALFADGPEGFPEARMGLWPLGLQCAWNAADGSNEILVADWSATFASIGGVILAGTGVLLIIEFKRKAKRQ